MQPVDSVVCFCLNLAFRSYYDQLEVLHVGQIKSRVIDLRQYPVGERKPDFRTQCVGRAESVLGSGGPVRIGSWSTWCYTLVSLRHPRDRQCCEQCDDNWT